MKGHGFAYIGVYDQGVVIESMSYTVRSTLGWRPSQWIGRQATGMVHPDDLAVIYATGEPKVSEPIVSRTRLARYRVVHSDGHYSWFDLTATSFSLPGSDKLTRVTVTAVPYAGLFRKKVILGEVRSK